MNIDFTQNYWETQWRNSPSHRADLHPVNPYLAVETAHLAAGTALDAGCGAGTEALWLAQHGWLVTAVDISPTALATAHARTPADEVGERIEWLEVDLSKWVPGRTWDLVVTNYAHAHIGQLPLYRRIAPWVAPGGTLLIVAHHDDHHASGAESTLAAITHELDPGQWF